MKTSVSVHIRSVKKNDPKPVITHSSVDFQNTALESVNYKVKMPATDFFQELKALIDAGDDSAWRIWR